MKLYHVCTYVKTLITGDRFNVELFSLFSTCEMAFFIINVVIVFFVFSFYLATFALVVFMAISFLFSMMVTRSITLS